MNERLEQKEIIERARNADVIRVLRRLGIRVGDEQRLIQCFRPENHKHNDEHPSMYIDRARNRVRCFVCDRAPLDPIDIVRAMRGVNFRHAVEFLTHKNIGNYVPTKKGDGEQSKLDKWRAKAFQILNCPDDNSLQQISDNSHPFGLTKDMNKLWQDLDHPSIGMLRYYIEERGIDFNTFLESGIRYVMNPVSLAEKSGHFDPVKADEHVAAIPHQRFGYRNAPVLYFHLRALNSETEPKELFCRKCPMFATFNAPGDYREGDPLLICEGHIDALTAASRGLSAISLPGGITSWREFYAHDIARMRMVPIIAFDAEPEADRKAFEILSELVTDHNIIGYRMSMPLGEDLNSWLNKCENALSRLARLDIPLLDPSGTVVGRLTLNFDHEFRKYRWAGKWNTRYEDRHPESNA